MRKGLLILWLTVLLAGIGSIFWYNEWVYSLPTPVPNRLVKKQMGEYVHMPRSFNSDTSKPVFLHFFNPTCPCSKFNIPHFKSLVKKYGEKVNFEIVVMSKDPYSAEQIQDKFDLQIPVLFDTTIAIACGVYSTPQAVILDTHRKLYYRGNYNKSRYCTDVKSNYAEMALDSLFTNTVNPVFNPIAVTAYGCQLPNCRK